MTPDCNTDAARCHSLQRMVRRLYETRQEAKQAKAAMRQLAEKIGKCEMHYEPGESGLECYNTNLPKERWCDICKQKLPVWENYHAKTNAASGALRALLHAARTLPPNAPHERTPEK